MYKCESMHHSAASIVGRESTLDYVVSAGPVKVDESGVLDYMLTDHKPIYCVVDGQIFLSWNLEGGCNHFTRYPAIKEYVRSITDKRPIFLFQELFLQTLLKKTSDQEARDAMAKERFDDMFMDENYDYKYDGYTGLIAYPRELTESKGKGLAFKAIQRPNSDKKCMVVSVGTKAGERYHVVNMHLKSVVTFPFSGFALHKQELANIKANLQNELEEGVVFIGDHNRKNVGKLYGSVFFPDDSNIALESVYPPNSMQLQPIRTQDNYF